MQILQSLKLQWMSLRYVFLSIFIFSLLYGILGCFLVQNEETASQFLLFFLCISMAMMLYIGYFYFSELGRTYIAIKNNRKAFLLSNLIGNGIATFCFFFCYLWIRTALIIAIHQSFGGIHLLVFLFTFLGLFALGNLVGAFLRKKEYLLLLPVLLFLLLTIFLHIPLEKIVFEYSKSMLQSFSVDNSYVLPSLGYILLFLGIGIGATILSYIQYYFLNVTKAYKA